MTKFNKILIKTIQLRERASFQMVSFHKIRTITRESIVQYKPLSEEDIIALNYVTKFHKILIKTTQLRERT